MSITYDEGQALKYPTKDPVEWVQVGRTWQSLTVEQMDGVRTKFEKEWREPKGGDMVWVFDIARNRMHEDFGIVTNDITDREDTVWVRIGAAPALEFKKWELLPMNRIGTSDMDAVETQTPRTFSQ